MPELLRRHLGGDIYCVHRLDKAAAGLMIYARSREAAARLSRLMAERELNKEYLAVVQGRPAPEAGRMEDLLFKDSTTGRSYVVTRMRKGVKEAALEYALLESREELSLVRICLITGRSHQIRAQFASRGLPLAGDVRYGSRFRDWPLALWSRRAAFVHPFTGKALDLSAPPPALPPWTDFESFGPGR